LAGLEDRFIYFKGKTFWDVVSENKKTVCVINPFIAYPAWKVNGIMVSGPVFESGRISAYPDNFFSQYNFPPLGGMVDFPEEKDLRGFLERTNDMANRLADVSLNMYKDQRPYLFFVSFLTLDRVKHFLWRFTDREDMYYPGETSYKDAIINSYKVYDSIVGRFRDALAEDESLLVISDHGHRRRCSHCLNLNEILRTKGYLKTKDSGVTGIMRKQVERMKVFTVATLSKHGFQDWIYKIAKYIPGRKALKKSTYMIHKESSSVSLSNLCGTNPYGGLDIRYETEKEYEELSQNVINELSNLNKQFGKKIVKWAAKREKIYKGKNEQKLPDILFELHEDYGVGMDLFTPMITENYSHKKISGGHKREAILLTYSNNCNVRKMERPDSIIGIKDYILEIIAH
jgi:predicted AlkP superfamily phosphohydrolase/phosphomutase